MDVTVAVATYGGEHWLHLAETRAIPSAQAQGVPVVHSHSLGGLHDARNDALAQVRTEWVIHLDADDELEAGYVSAMATASADVRAPAVRYISRAGAASWPAVPHVAGHDHHTCEALCLRAGNWLVVGAAVRADLVRKVGGWRDFCWSEDWDLWLRCHLTGATFEAVPAAVYRAHVRSNSRNRGQSRAAKLDAHRAIAAANGVESP
jgi:GT2 family glycosyltransferase